MDHSSLHGIRVCLDLRRSFATGVGRVSLNFATALLSDPEMIQGLTLITSPSNYQATLKVASETVRVEVVDYQYFSRADLFELPKFVDSLASDLYIAPQFYISPFIKCTTIKMVHDIWPIIYPDWVPSPEELNSHFGAEAYEGIAYFMQWFDQNKEAFASWAIPEFRQLFEERRINLADAYMLAMYASAVDTAAAVPTCSHFSKQQIARVFPQAESKLEVIYPYVIPKIELDTKKLSRRTFRVLHVGKFEPRKNHLLLCKAFVAAYNQLSDNDKANAELMLVGDISYRNYGREVKDYIDGLSQRYPIRFVGVVNDAELAECYRSANIFVFPSSFEGFGIPIIEAMSYGLPTIIASWGGMAEAAGNAAFTVDALNEGSLMEAMLEVFHNESLYMDLVQRGLQRAKQFPFATMKEQLFKVLSVAAKRGSPMYFDAS